MTIYSRQSKGFRPTQSSSDHAPIVRPWMAPAPSPPVIRKPAFMLGGRFAVIREPHFMLGVAPAAKPPEHPTDGALSVVDPSDESPHET